MKKILCILPLLLLCSFTFGQTIEKSQAEMVYDIVPTTAPCTYCSEIVYVRADSSEYRWDGDSWEKWNNGIIYTWVQDSIRIGTKLGVEVSRDTTRTSGAGGGSADGVATAGIYDAANDEIDITVASPGTNFSIDVSDLAEDADVTASLNGKLDTVIVLQLNDTTFAVHNYINGSIVRADTITIVGSGGGGSTAIPTDEIAYGSGTGITSSSELTRITGGIQAGDIKIAEGAGTNSLVHGNTAAASSGGNWIAQGTNAGASNTTGYAWIAQGTNCGFSSTTGFGWVAQGASAGYSNTTGRQWIAQGFESAYSNVSGSYWIAQGYFAGRAALGSDWVAIGRLAGSKQNTSGGNWVALGSFAANSYAAGGDALSFSNSIYIGSNTTVGAVGADNETVIGYDADGNGSNTVTIGNTSVTDVYLSGTTNTDDLALTVTDVVPTGAEGILYADDSENRLKYYNGTSFEALAYQSDISGGSMSSFDMESDDTTPFTVNDGETVSILGTVNGGIDTRDGTGNEILIELDFGELVGLGTIAGTEIVPLFDNVGGNHARVDMDDIKDYINTDVAIANTVTSGRPAQWNGTGNQLDAFPLENTGGLVRQTQSTAFELASGSTGLAPSATTPGRLRWNTSTSKFTVSDGTSHQNVATEAHVSTEVESAMPDVAYTEDSDLAIFPNRPIEHVTLKTTSGASSDTNLSLPTASSSYAGYQVIVWSEDLSGTHNNTVSASAIQDGSSSVTSITLGNYQSTTISCILSGASTYRWTITNQY